MLQKVLLTIKIGLFQSYKKKKREKKLKLLQKFNYLVASFNDRFWWKIELMKKCVYIIWGRERKKGLKVQHD